MATTADHRYDASASKKNHTISRWSTNRMQEIVAGYLFIAPAFISLFIFLVVPILASFVLVFMRYDVLSPPSWNGFENLSQLSRDGRLQQVYWNTFRFVVFATFFNNLLGLLLAMGVNRAMPSIIKYLLRTALFFPVLTTTASLALVWNFLLTQDRGVVNYLLQQVGLPPVPWLSSSSWAMVSVVMFDVWRVWFSHGHLFGRPAGDSRGLVRSRCNRRGQSTATNPLYHFALNFSDGFLRNHYLDYWSSPSLRQRLGANRRRPWRCNPIDCALCL